MTTKPRKATRAAWGKVRKLPSGRYQASYVGPDGERYTGPMTYTSKVDADAWLSTQRAAIVNAEWKPTTSTAKAVQQVERAKRLGAYAEEWMTTRTNARGDKLRPRTVAEYKRLLKGPLASLTKKPLVELEPDVIRKWRATEIGTGRKTQTSRAYGLLNAILSTAVEDKLIVSNPCTVKGGQSTHTGRKVTPPTDVELNTILESISAQYKALVVIAAVGGLRYGEATELRGRDVVVERDEDGQVVSVRIQVERAVTHTTEDGFQVGEPKSEAGVRVVGIFGVDAEVVADHLKKHSGRFPDQLLFPARDGVTHLAQSTFWKHWNPARKAADRSDMPFHALRHYAGTRYAQAGATPRETMARLGHSSAAAAMRYQHAGNRDDELAARMARRTV